MMEFASLLQCIYVYIKSSSFLDPRTPKRMPFVPSRVENVGDRQFIDTLNGFVRFYFSIFVFLWQACGGSRCMDEHILLHS